MQWNDIDLPKATIMVRRTLTEVNGELLLSEPKTAKGRRRIDLPTIADEALWKHKAAMLVEGHAGVEWVFCNHGGGHRRRSHFHQQYFKPLLEKAGLATERYNPAVASAHPDPLHLNTRFQTLETAGLCHDR